MMALLKQPTRRRALLIVLLVAINLILATTILPLDGALGLNERLPVFAAIFLGIFIEAAPFLMLGTLGSGLVEVFLQPDRIQRWMPRSRLGAALFGGLLGLLFPVCECGVVPLSRRLMRKGMPSSAGVAFLLAAPVLNPVVIASTAAAFGVGRIFWLRMGLTLLIAVVVGLVFSVAKSPWEILRPTAWVTANDYALPAAPLIPISAITVDAAGSMAVPIAAAPTTAVATRIKRIQQVLLIALDEFFEMGRYMVIGALLAAAMQTFVPQSMLLAVGRGPLLSVLALMALAVILSICSTVDAFIALGFVGAFSPGAIVAFLVFGPMVDIKSVLMFLRVFHRRSVAYLVLLPFAISLLAGLLINYYMAP